MTKLFLGDRTRFLGGIAMVLPYSGTLHCVQRLAHLAIQSQNWYAAACG